MISLIRFVYAICVGVTLTGLALWIHPVETASFVLWIVAALVTSLVLGAVEKHIESRLRGPLSGATSGLGGNWGPTDTSTLWRYTAYLCGFVIMLSALVVVATPYEGLAFLVIAINVLTPVAAWTIDRQLQLHSPGLYAAAYVLAFFAIAGAAMIAVTPGSYDHPRQVRFGSETDRPIGSSNVNQGTNVCRVRSALRNHLELDARDAPTLPVERTSFVGLLRF